MAKQPSLDDFRVPYGTRDKAAAAFTLDAFDPAAKPFSSGSKDTDRERLSAVSIELDTHQERLHAQHKKRVLLVLQGMDTSGKDGTVRAVFREVDPLGLRVVPFKAPTPIEAAHDSCGACTRRCRPRASSRSSTAATMKTCWCRACSA
jgi:polyphosphate kinase 2 (PPK2 family)